MRKIKLSSVSEDLKGANSISANAKGQAGGRRSWFVFYTHPRICWDHYHILLCHCRLTLVNLCQGHTHIHTQTSNLHCYYYILCMPTTTPATSLPNVIYKYTQIYV